jgi:hypothetical protein
VAASEIPGGAVLDPVAEHLIAHIIGAQDELTTRLRAVETTAVTLSAAWSAAGTLEAVAGTTDHDQAMLDQVRRVAAEASALRAVRRRRLQGLRRQLALYRQDLGVDPPESQARPPTVRVAGRRVLAVQSVGESGGRTIEGQHEPPTRDETVISPAQPANP